MKGQSSYLQKKAENFAEWIGFYRQNPHRFMEDYFGTHLHPFQRFLFYMMNKDDKFMYIAARGLKLVVQSSNWLDYQCEIKLEA